MDPKQPPSPTAPDPAARADAPAPAGPARPPPTPQTPPGAGRPPPPPPQSALRAPTAPGAGRPSGSLLSPVLSTQAKFDLAAMALRLRDEQIEAKVIYYGADQRTNKDLDAITDAVVAELMALKTAKAPAAAQTDVEIELIGNLRGLLEKLFSKRREGFLLRKIEEIQRRITTLFFNSELFAKLAAGSTDARVLSWPDQALYYLVQRHKDALLADLRAMQFASPSVLAESVERFERIENNLKMDFLSRTTPELEKLLEIFRQALVAFFREFAESLGEFAWEVVRESRVAQRGSLTTTRLGPGLFHDFREAFDKKFLVRLVETMQEPVVRRSIEMRGTFRDETLRFVADPHIYSEICAVMCNACYDFLHSEGFLDLPPQWRAHLDRS